MYIKCLHLRTHKDLRLQTASTVWCQADWKNNSLGYLSPVLARQSPTLKSLELGIPGICYFTLSFQQLSMYKFQFYPAAIFLNELVHLIDLHSDD